MNLLTLLPILLTIFSNRVDSSSSFSINSDAASNGKDFYYSSSGVLFDQLDFKFEKHAVKKRQAPAAGLRDECQYASIKAEAIGCTENSNTCYEMLDCIASLDIKSHCKQPEEQTPAVWLINVFQILHLHGFCDLHESCNGDDNEYANQMLEIMRNTYQYSPAFLNQPRIDNKIYCSKAHYLVDKVKGLLREYYVCYNETFVDVLLQKVDESAGVILDNNCPYCISANYYFDDCLSDASTGLIENCSNAFSCIKNKIEIYKCDKDRDVTALTVTTKFIQKMSEICQQENISNISVNEFLSDLNSCLKQHSFLGLTLIQAPPGISYCGELDGFSQCIERKMLSYHHLLFDELELNDEAYRSQLFRLKRTCFESQLTTTLSPFIRPLTPSFHKFENNSEQTVFEDDNLYYHTTVVRAEIDQNINWVNLDSDAFDNHSVKNDQDLSESYLKAAVVKLSFKFPYYGHYLEKVVVATGGFIYTGNVMHPLITKAQYIAPLMANFDPKIGNRSVIKYVDNGTHFICTWENLYLQDQVENGEYTFQVVLSNKGTITFNYFKIPIVAISNFNHNLKVGLSDAYIYYTILSNNKFEYTIFQYHTVNVSIEDVKTGNSVLLFMLENCLQLNTCDKCVKGVANFKCIWCPKLQRCSDMIDRNRQEWMEASCPTKADLIQNNQTCVADREFSALRITQEDAAPEFAKTALIGVVVTVVLVLAIAVSIWAGYAYTHPNTPSGIWLIEHRPSRLMNMVSSHINNRGSSEA